MIRPASQENKSGRGHKTDWARSMASLRDVKEREYSSVGGGEIDSKDHQEITLSSLNAATKNGMLEVKISPGN